MNLKTPAGLSSSQINSGCCNGMNTCFEVVRASYLSKPSQVDWGSFALFLVLESRVILLPKYQTVFPIAAMRIANRY